MVSRACRLGVALIVACLLVPCWGDVMCPHEDDDVEAPTPGIGSISGNITLLTDGRPITDTVGLNLSKLYRYENFNVTTMNQPDRYRKLIISLEPCHGVAYLLVRKTRRCYPNPHTCCRPLPGATFEGQPLTQSSAPPCSPALHEVNCDWTHFHSVVDSSRDGAPSFFEVPLTSAKYFILVYAPSDINLNNGVQRARFRLTVLSDIGAYPRPGLEGRLSTRQQGERALELSWDPATFMPVGVSGLRNYHIYSSLLLATDRKQNEAVFLRPNKVMNSVCGLERNAVKYGSPLTSTDCTSGVCTATISGILPRRRYMLNIVAESFRNYNSSYSGIIVSTDWIETDQLMSENVIALIGGICGTVFGVVVIGYLWIVKLYN